MNFFKTYCTLLPLLLFSCEDKEENKSTRLVHRRVFAVADSVPEKKAMVKADTSYLGDYFRMNGLTDIHTLDSTIKVDLRYADTSNFLKRGFYDGLRKAYFPCEVAIRICNAQHFLKKVKPSYSLLILDAARPLHIQQMIWDSLKMPAERKFNYVAPPHTISMHNYGCAVDVSIIDTESGKMLNMGTDYDHFEKLSEPSYEWKFLKSGELSIEAFENRKLLRSVMKAAGLDPITSEWWHFNYKTKVYASENFRLLK